MSKDDTEKTKDKIKPFSTLTGGKKTTQKKETRNARHQIYVTDTQFKKAMELVNSDMNNALQLGNLANTQHYFLVKFLVQKGLLNEDEFTHFMQEELVRLNSKEKDE